ncbi:MAG: hypothetical protein NT074_01065, partial [Methanomicrobiales archaeon]|nr:hypothetical protein [Methanomicrobiales archaeon]
GDYPVDIYQNFNRSKKWFNKWLNRYHTGKTDWYKDLSKRPHVISKKTDRRIENAVVGIRKSLMDGSEDSTRFFFVGAEAIQFQMEEMGYEPSDIPSQSTIKRVIKRNKLDINKKERYKRIKSKGRYTILKPKCINEMHQMDFVGPRYIKDFGSINSLHLKDVVGRQVAGKQFVEKSMNNVLDFLLDYWKSHPIPKYLQVDNGMSFAGDYTHPRTFSRFVRLCLYVGTRVVFITPAKPWMNGTIEEFNKGFDRLVWRKEIFVDLSDIQAKSAIFFASQNKFNTWKLREKDLNSITPKRILRRDFTIDLNNIPLVEGKIHFIRMVDSKGNISVLNERFHVGEEYIGEYITAFIDTREQLTLGIDLHLNISIS